MIYRLCRSSLYYPLLRRNKYMEENNIILQKARTSALAHDWQTATRLYRQLVRSQPDRIDLLEELSSLYINCHEDNKALPILQQIVALSPNNVKNLTTLGRVYRTLRRYDDSIEVLSQALVLDSENTDIYYNLGFTYKYMDRYDDAIECLETVISKNPLDVLAYNHLGRIYEAKKDYDKALQCYKSGLKIDPNHPILHLNMAKTLEKTKQDAQAVSEYEAALKARPCWLEAIDNFSALLMRGNRCKEAGYLIQQALRLDDKNLKMYSRLGDAYFRQGIYDQSCTEYNNALKIESQYMPALSGLADSYERMGMMDEACDTIGVLEKFHGENKDVLCHAASIYLRSGRTQEAANRIKQLYKEAKTSPQVLDVIGQYYINEGQYDKAEACANRIKELDEHYNNHYLSWGKMYEKIGDNKAAEASYNIASTKCKNKGEALSNMAHLYERAGEQSKAIEYYRMAAEQDSQNIQYAQKKKAIEDAVAHENIQNEDANIQNTASATVMPPSPPEESAVDIDFLNEDFNTEDTVTEEVEDDFISKDFDTPYQAESVPPVELDLDSLGNDLPIEPIADMDDFLEEAGAVDVNNVDEKTLDNIARDASMPIEDTFEKEELHSSNVYDDILVTGEDTPRPPSPHSPPPVAQYYPPMSAAPQYLPQYIAQPIVMPQYTSPAIHTLPELLHNLRDLCDYLPVSKKKEYNNSNASGLLNHIITKLEGKGGLLLRASLRRQILGLDPTSKANEENIDAINYIVNDMKDMSSSLDDSNLSLAFNEVLTSIKKKLS